MMSRTERLLINLSTLLVAVSGILYAWMKYLMSPIDEFAVVNHPWQPWMLPLHVLAAPAMLFAIGLVAREHILSQIRKGPGRAGRGTGLVAVACLLPMVSTGYLIQVVTGETARQVAVVVHLTTGIIYTVMFAAHLVVSRRIAARRKANGAMQENGLAGAALRRARQAGGT
ncbi:MAG TPA: hypothetical protein VJV23_12135, partial [Candidatus Polarisedimenticolia bacterium]|nr:hypothetical protein [Candidatus Polarisedimenticolia bacterium]